MRILFGSTMGGRCTKNMTRHQPTTRTYGEDFMHLTREMFHKWWNWISEKVHDPEGKEHLVWIVFVPFWLTQYVNDGQFLPGGYT